MTSSPRPLTFRTKQRLSGKLNFAAVFNGRTRKDVGPLTVRGRVNGLPHCRLGLSIGRRVGNSPERHRLKRMVREAFRLSQYDWAVGMDVVVTARRHEPFSLAEYQRIWFTAMRALQLQARQQAERSQRLNGAEGTEKKAEN